MAAQKNSVFDKDSAKYTHYYSRIHIRKQDR